MVHFYSFQTNNFLTLIIFLTLLKNYSYSLTAKIEYIKHMFVFFKNDEYAQKYQQYIKSWPWIWLNVLYFPYQRYIFDFDKTSLFCWAQKEHQILVQHFYSWSHCCHWTKVWKKETKNQRHNFQFWLYFLHILRFVDWFFFFYWRNTNVNLYDSWYFWLCKTWRLYCYHLSELKILKCVHSFFFCFVLFEYYICGVDACSFSCFILYAYQDHFQSLYTERKSFRKS